MTRETSLRKKPSNSRMNPPRKSRGIHDLLLPLATKEMHSAINHRNRASFRITEVDYTTGEHATVISFIVSTEALPDRRNLMQRRSWS